MDGKVYGDVVGDVESIPREQVQGIPFGTDGECLNEEVGITNSCDQDILLNKKLQSQEKENQERIDGPKLKSDEEKGECEEKLMERE